MDESELTKSINAIKIWIDHLSDIALDLDSKNIIYQQEYDKYDLSSIIALFIHVVWNIWAANCIEKFNHDITKWAIIAQEFWKNIRQSVSLYTWIDPAEIFDNINARL